MEGVNGGAIDLDKTTVTLELDKVSSGVLYVPGKERMLYKPSERKSLLGLDVLADARRESKNDGVFRVPRESLYQQLLLLMKMRCPYPQDWMSLKLIYRKVHEVIPDVAIVETLQNIHLIQMCIFCLPTSSVIPLHDHPGMTLLSKIFYGSMHVKGYDWVKPACIQKVGGFSVRLSKLAVDKVLTAPCGISALYQRLGVICTASLQSWMNIKYFLVSCWPMANQSLNWC